MLKEQGQKFMDAVKAADIKSFSFRTMNTFNMYNDGEHSLILINGDDILNIRAPYAQASIAHKGNVMCIHSEWAAISECMVAGDHKQIKKFVEAFGVTLTNDQVKVLINIDSANRDIIPVQGDYNGFRELTPDEIAELSKEDKAKYDKDLADYNERKKQGNSTFSSSNFVAQVTV